jgi:RyR domain-containing protein
VTYTPRPIDTSRVSLSAEFDDLIERLAASNHDYWALQRIAEGWRLGERRDDRARTHPDLKPYDELPESEKGYDRVSVVETLKAIVALGYAIEKLR